MKLLDIKHLLNDDIKFSKSEIEKAVVLMTLGALAIIFMAALTFEGEYITCLTLERLLEYLGVLNENWLSRHHTLFLHEIQLLFIATFIFEMFFLISRYMRGWKL